VVGQDRRFIHTFGANALFRASDIPLEQARRCRVLYLGGYLLMDRVVPEELRALFAEVRYAGVKTVLDVVTPGPADYLSRLAPVLPEVDVFLPNDHEAELITGQKDPARQAETLYRLGARTTIITRGDQGAVLVSERTRLRAGSFPIPFVDGSGGGDAFAAGYVTGLLSGLDEEGCLLLASALGASCVRTIGTTTGVFTRAECEAFLKENTLQIEKW
jgi:sugar/nucleoside kinase (ribokinase family)